MKVSLRASVALIALASGAPMAIAQTAPPAVPTASEAQEGDIVLIAGKGHETGQIVGTKILPFSDHEAVAEALRELAA